MKKPIKNFQQFLDDSLSVSQNAQLPELLRGEKTPLSAHRITKIKQDPRKMTADEVLSIAKLVKRAPAWLSEVYQCGSNNVSRDVMESINKKFQEEVNV